MKGHSTNFPNLIMDEALRLAAYSDSQAEAFLLDVVEVGETVVWGKRQTGREGTPYIRGYHRVTALAS